MTISSCSRLVDQSIHYITKRDRHRHRHRHIDLINIIIAAIMSYGYGCFVKAPCLLFLLVVLGTVVKGTTSSSDAAADADADADADATTTPPSAKPCGVYLAMSALPGTGIGMFAGRDYEAHEFLLELGDHIIPIVDIKLHHEDLSFDNSFFLWDEYTWDADVARASHEGTQSVDVASPGFGAAANSFLDFVNVEEGTGTWSDPHDLHRSKDPGAGGFSIIHSRMATASKKIASGQELFVSYGSAWFVARPKLGAIPVKGDFAEAQKLLERYQMNLIDRYNTTTLFSETIQLEDEIWNIFVSNSEWKNTSRIMAALPATQQHRDEAAQLAGGLHEFRQGQLVRSHDWLEEHGVCADNMRIEPSTIHQAGNGVVANRYLHQHQVILPVPMIHIPNRTVLELYERFQGDKLQVNREKRTGYQLLLNYCLGHGESSVLLSPYGPVFALINHNQTLVNVKLQWADPERSNHHPELLQQPVDALYNISSSRLAMEVVALRDILPGEELFLDYGDEWEAAWQDHVAHWQPLPGAQDYRSAETMNQKRHADTQILLTEFEQMKTQYPANVGLKFNVFFLNSEWPQLVGYNDQGEVDVASLKSTSVEWIDCEILRHERDEEEDEEDVVKGGSILYTVAVQDQDTTTTTKKSSSTADQEKEKKKKKKMILVKNVPREAFQFINRPYTSDMLLTNAFRHDIRIPDEIFPERWKNQRHQDKRNVNVGVQDSDDDIQPQEL